MTDTTADSAAAPPTVTDSRHDADWLLPVMFSVAILAHSVLTAPPTAVVQTSRAASGVELAGRFVIVLFAPLSVLRVRVCWPSVVTTVPPVPTPSLPSAAACVADLSRSVPKSPASEISRVVKIGVNGIPSGMSSPSNPN